MENAAQALYQARNTNATINGYQAVGSGTGEADIIKKLVDWGGTDVPMAQSDINKDEPAGTDYTTADFLQIPIGLGGVAIPFNVPGLTVKKLVLTASVLANIYLGKITQWNSGAIQALNPKVKLPKTRIIVVARGDSSGTTYIFTNFLHAAAPTVWTTGPAKTAAHASRLMASRAAATLASPPTSRTRRTRSATSSTPMCCSTRAC